MVALCCLGCLGTSAGAEEAPGVHYRHSGVTSPGAIGTWQLQRGGPLPGYFQPVEIQGPEGVEISLAVEGTWDEPRPAPLLVGFLIAPVYRFKVTGIPWAEGQELFPTIEVIDRLYTPAGQETRFPIPIELAQDDLEQALAGKFVTRVIYLEDPDRALPHGQVPPGHETWFDVGPGGNPVKMADELGRPVAILRLGGRIPIEGETGIDRGFLYGCPPLVTFQRDPSRTVLGALEAEPEAGSPADDARSHELLPAGYSRQVPHPLVRRALATAPTGGDGTSGRRR